MQKSISIAIILALSLLLLAGITAHAENIDGDVNGDGVVNILDLTLVAAYFGKTVDPTQVPNPDANGDGIVNIMDLVLVANAMGRTATGGHPHLWTWR